MLSTTERDLLCLHPLFVQNSLGISFAWTTQLNFLGFLNGLVNGSHHVEGLLGQMIALTGHNHLEAANGLGQ